MGKCNAKRVIKSENKNGGRGGGGGLPERDNWVRYGGWNI